jgi:hypothetical protein
MRTHVASRIHVAISIYTNQRREISSMGPRVPARALARRARGVPACRRAGLTWRRTRSRQTENYRSACATGPRGFSWYTARLLAPYPSSAFRSVRCRSRQLCDQGSATERQRVLAGVLNKKLSTRTTYFCPNDFLNAKTPHTLKKYGWGSSSFPTSHLVVASFNLPLS